MSSATAAGSFAIPRWRAIVLTTSTHMRRSSFERWLVICRSKEVPAPYLATYALDGYTVFAKQYNAAAKLTKSIDLVYQTMLAELGQRSLDACVDGRFPSRGSVHSGEQFRLEHWLSSASTAKLWI
ncbi:hypothetical protein ACVMH6_002236 [Rhizobium leguminosarum]